MSTAEQLTDPVAYHAEGPCWSAQWGGLRWVDMLAGDVLSLAADGTVSRRHVGDVAAVVRPRAGGGAVLAVERGFALEEPDGSVRALPELWGAEARTRMNEGGCDPDGRLYVGSMAYDQGDGRGDGRGSVYRLDPDGSVEVAWGGVTISNGLGFSPDGSRAYYVDTPTGRIDVLDYDPAAGLTGRRPLVQVTDHGPGHPDGLTVDAEGYVWVALFGGGGVRRYAPDGTLDGVLEVPGASQVTAVTFGGADLDQLFITTSRENLPADAEPVAGSLFTHRPGVRGLPVLPFAG